MPDSCCAVGCTNRKAGGTFSLSFYKIPSGKTPIEQRRRQAWIKAIRKDDWKDWPYDKISKAKICSAHFITGKRSDDPNHPDWVPSVFSFTPAHKVTTSVQKRQRQERYDHVNRKKSKSSVNAKVSLNFEGESFSSEETECDNKNSSDKSMQTDIWESFILEENNKLRKHVEDLDNELRARNLEVYNLRKEIEKLKQKCSFGFEKIKESDSWINFFTGLSTLSIFAWVVKRMKNKVDLCHNRLSLHDHVLIVFMKLRLGLLNKDIAYRFGLQTTVVSSIYRKYLPVISNNLQNLIIWPDRASIRRNLPHAFKNKFRDAVCTIDCSEIFISRPSNLTARAKTWSNYKHHNTIKYLIGISPAGAVTFLSAGWGGRVSDKQITIESGFINRLSPGDCVLADRGFLVQREINEAGATLKMPSFTKGKKQLSAREVDESRQLAHIRIHVERVIGRMKNFRILQTIIPISQVDLLDNVMVTVCACINLNKSVVGKKKVKVANKK